jgi:hypothetical protein
MALAYSPGMDTELCARCGRQITLTSEEFADGGSVDGRFVCGACLTPAEQEQIGEQDMDLAGGIAELAAETGVTIPIVDQRADHVAREGQEEPPASHG